MAPVLLEILIVCIIKGMELCCLIMGRIMKEIGGNKNRMEKGGIFFKMEIIMKGIL